MNSVIDIQRLKPNATTLEKALDFISCASKQGRVSIVMYASPGVVEQLESLGFNLLRDRITTVPPKRYIEVSCNE